MSSDDENRNRTVFRPSPLQGLRNKDGQAPQQGGFPPQQGGFPPQQGGFPPPPQQGGFPPQQPQQPYPPQPAQAPFPQQQQPYPPPQQPQYQEPQYPQAQQPYPPQPQYDQGPVAQQAPYAGGQQPAYQGGPQQSERLPDDDVPRPALAPKVRNVMMDQAAPALALAASVRSGRVQTGLPQLHGQATQLIGVFERALQNSSYPEEVRNRAKYALCATVDDIAQNLPGQSHDGAEWARRSMTVQFFSENIGGDRFWQLVDDMLRSPASNADLIELYHACLSAGFEGRFRVMGDGRRRLDEVASRLYAALEHVRGLSELEVSPHWKGKPTPASRVGFWGPLLLAIGAALALLFLVYLILRFILMQTADPPSNELTHINPGEPLSLGRAATPPPQTADAQKQQLEQFLAPQIAAHEVVVIDDATTVRVRTTIGELFKSGSDQLSPGKSDLFVQIGDAIQKTQQGPVQVAGYADSDKVATLEFPDNMALSVARAKTVGAIIQGRLQDPSRVTTQGFGETQPIASNDTPDGKSQNRRVEVIVQRNQ